jgi:Cdc25 family phosphatase
MPELVRKLKDKDTVVFHCALSQQRGPSAALLYLRERERLLGASVKPSPTPISAMVKKSTAENNESEGGDGTWGDAPAGQEEEEGGGEEKKEQKVYVLDRGFVRWQELYGEDGRLTEGYVKEIWKDGYWI